MTESYSEIQAAAIDGRTHNVFHRQAQLERLIQAFLKRVPELKEAIVADYGHTVGETAVELNLTLESLKQDCSSIQPAKAHAEEYLVAAGKSAPANRKPFGIAYIEPCSHTLLYSVLVPVSAAIAAGNCVIVLLEQNLRVLPGLLRQILTSALQADTFAVASSPIRDQAFLDEILTVDQRSTEQWPRANQLASSATSRSVAVVDRTADVRLAAKELVAARFSFGGRSPYAPDIVLINEFIKQDFLQAVVAECASLGNTQDLNGSVKAKPSRDTKVKEAVESLNEADADCRVLLQEQKMAVVDLVSRKTELIAAKTTAPVLVVHGIRSLDDAVDLISSTSSTPALCAFHFSNTKTGKYLSQFVDASVSFVNLIPRQILVGPAFPSAAPIDVDVRYPTELFSLARPVFQLGATSSLVLAKALFAPRAAKDTAIRKLMADVSAPTKPKGRHPGGGVGFFEQGILISASIILTTALSLTGTGIYWVVKNRKSLW